MRIADYFKVSTTIGLIGICCGLVYCGQEDESTPETISDLADGDGKGDSYNSSVPCNQWGLLSESGTQSSCTNCNERICQGMFQRQGSEPTRVTFSENYTVVRIKYPWYKASGPEMAFRANNLNALCDYLFPGSAHIPTDGYDYIYRPWANGSGELALAACFDGTGKLITDTSSDGHYWNLYCGGGTAVQVVTCKSKTGTPMGREFIPAPPKPVGPQPNGKTCTNNGECQSNNCIHGPLYNHSFIYNFNWSKVCCAPGSCAYSLSAYNDDGSSSVSGGCLALDQSSSWPPGMKCNMVNGQPQIQWANGTTCTKNTDCQSGSCKPDKSIVTLGAHTASKLICSPK